MKKAINRVLIQFIIYLIIVYITNKVSDTYISGGIAGMLCLVIGESINDLEAKTDKD